MAAKYVNLNGIYDTKAQKKAKSNGVTKGYNNPSKLSKLDYEISKNNKVYDTKAVSAQRASDNRKLNELAEKAIAAHKKKK